MFDAMAAKGSACTHYCCVIVLKAEGNCNVAGQKPRIACIN